MKLIIKNFEKPGFYQEVDYVIGSGIVGTSIMSVHFDARDCYEDQECFIKDLRESILPRISPDMLESRRDGRH